VIVPVANGSAGPAGGWLRRASPLPKLAWLVSVTCVAFATYHPVPLLVIVGAGLLVAAAAGILRAVGRGLAWLAPLTASIVLLQGIAPALCAGACAPLFAVGPVTVYLDGIGHGLSLVARILAMEIVALAVLVTTHPADLFAALRRLRLPHDLAFLVAMTLQLVPVVSREVLVVLDARRARGAAATGVAALVPTLLPAFVGTVERMGQLAISLESRGFGATASRTSYRRVRASRIDGVAAAVAVVAGLAGTVAGIAWWGPGSWPVAALPPSIALAAFCVALATTTGVVISGARAWLRATS
jgi:energy-coupling factor transport system permease protein